MGRGGGGVSGMQWLCVKPKARGRSRGGTHGESTRRGGSRGSPGACKLEVLQDYLRVPSPSRVSSRAETLISPAPLPPPARSA